LLLYWILFAVFVAGTLFTTTVPKERQLPTGPMFVAAGLFVALLVGLRYKVGGDWDTYAFIFTAAGRRDLFGAMDLGDPAYQAVNWLVFQAGFDIWAVNLICGIIFTWGLFRLCRTQPFPWAAVLVAVPYVIIVMAMGYTRQAVALGLLMAGLASFLRTGSSLRFAAYVFAAALFHKTAIIAFPLVALSAPRNRLLNWLFVPALSLWFYDLFLGDAMDGFVKHYVTVHYSSQGAAVRVLMNLFAAFLFALFRNRLGFSQAERALWRNFSLAAVLMTILLIIVPSSAAVDRMSLYMTPLQIGIIGRAPFLFRSRLPGTAALVVYAFSVEFVWLNFAQFSNLWVPYRFFPF
jgi:hypothetical protein